MREVVFTDHAREALLRRQLTEDEVRAVIHAPDQVLRLRPGRVLMRSLRRPSPGQVYLLRVVVDERLESHEVVTAYRTSQIARYWQGGR